MDASRYMSVGSRRKSAPTAGTHVFCLLCKERHCRRYPDLRSLYCEVIFNDVSFTQFVHKDPRTGQFHCPRCHRTFQDPGCLEEHASRSQACQATASATTSQIQLDSPSTSNAESSVGEWHYYTGHAYTQSPQKAPAATLMVSPPREIGGNFQSRLMTGAQSDENGFHERPGGNPTKESTPLHAGVMQGSLQEADDEEEDEVEQFCFGAMSPENLKFSPVPSLQWPDSDQEMEEVEEDLQSGPFSPETTIATWPSLMRDVSCVTDEPLSGSSGPPLVAPVSPPLNTAAAVCVDQKLHTPDLMDLDLPPASSYSPGPRHVPVTPPPPVEETASGYEQPQTPVFMALLLPPTSSYSPAPRASVLSPVPDVNETARGDEKPPTPGFIELLLPPAPSHSPSLVLQVPAVPYSYTPRTPCSSHSPAPHAAFSRTTASLSPACSHSPTPRAVAASPSPAPQVLVAPAPSSPADPFPPAARVPVRTESPVPSHEDASYPASLSDPRFHVDNLKLRASPPSIDVITGLAPPCVKHKPAKVQTQPAAPAPPPPPEPSPPTPPPMVLPPNLLGSVHTFLRSLPTDLSALAPALEEFGCRSAADLDALCTMGADERAVLQRFLHTAHATQWPALRAGLDERAPLLSSSAHAPTPAAAAVRAARLGCASWGDPVCAFLSALRPPLVRHAALLYVWGLRGPEDLDALCAARHRWDAVVREELLGRGLTVFEWLVLRDGLKARIAAADAHANASDSINK